MKCANFQMENLDASHVPIFFRLSISYKRRIQQWVIETNVERGFMYFSFVIHV